MDDLELLHRYVSHGDRDAVSCLIREHQNMVFFACLRRLGCASDAEDAAQQVFVAMIQNARGIHSSVRQWLYRCSINVSASMVRASRNRVHHEREKARQTKGYCGSGEAERREALSILKDCLGELKAADQKALVDNQVDGLTQQAIAYSTGVTQQAVAKRIGRLVLHLRRKMKSKGVIFSLLAAVLLAAKRMASAAIPESLKAVLTRASSAALSAVGAGTVGAIKVGATAIVLLAAVATYECAEERVPGAAAPQADHVCVTGAIRAAGGGVIRPSPFQRNWPLAGGVASVGGSPGRTGGQQVQRDLGPEAPSAPGTSEPLASRRPLNVPPNHGLPQGPQAGPQVAPGRALSFLSSPALGGTTLDSRPDPTAADGDGGTKPGPAPGEGLDLSSLDARTDGLGDPASGDAVHTGLMAWRAFPHRQVVRMNQAVWTVFVGPTSKIGPTNRSSAKLVGDPVWSDLASLSGFAEPGALPNWTELSRPSADDSEVQAASLVGIGESKAPPQKRAVSPAAVEPVTPRGLIGLSKLIAVADGAGLGLVDKIGGSVVNQGVGLVEDDISSLYLSGPASGGGSNIGGVVFAGRFSPGNSPPSVDLVDAILDPGNVLKMYLTDKTPPGLDLDNEVPWDAREFIAGGSPQVVPEPITLVLMLAGAAGLPRGLGWQARGRSRRQGPLCTAVRRSA